MDEKRADEGRRNGSGNSNNITPPPLSVDEGEENAVKEQLPVHSLGFHHHMRSACVFIFSAGERGGDWVTGGAAEGIDWRWRRIWRRKDWKRLWMKILRRRSICTRRRLPWTPPMLLSTAVVLRHTRSSETTQVKRPWTSSVLGEWNAHGSGLCLVCPWRFDRGGVRSEGRRSRNERLVSVRVGIVAVLFSRWNCAASVLKF